MIDLIALIETYGPLWVTVLGIVLIVIYVSRSGFMSARAGADQQTVVTKMALAAQERSIKLEDSRYAAMVRSSKLLMRVQQLEFQVQRLPSVEAEVQRLKEELRRALQERDDAMEALQEELIEKAKLMGRVEVLEKHILKLEAKIERMQNYERDKIEYLEDLDVDRTHPLVEFRDIAGRRTGDDTGADEQSGDGDGESGERDGDPTE